MPGRAGRGQISGVIEAVMVSQNILGNTSNRGGKDGVFQWLAGLFGEISQGWRWGKFLRSRTLLIRFTFYLQHPNDSWIRTYKKRWIIKKDMSLKVNSKICDSLLRTYVFYDSPFWYGLKVNHIFAGPKRGRPSHISLFKHFDSLWRPYVLINNCKLSFVIHF